MAAKLGPRPGGEKGAAEVRNRRGAVCAALLRFERSVLDAVGKAAADPGSEKPAAAGGHEEGLSP